MHPKKNFSNNDLMGLTGERRLNSNKIYRKAVVDFYPKLPKNENTNKDECKFSY